MLLEFLALSAVAIYLAYRWATANHNFFKDRGLPYSKPKLFVGSMGDMLLHRKSLFDIIVDLYNESDSKLYGIFEQRNPLLMIRDPELIKQIAIKDFEHFANHRNAFGSADDNDAEDADNLFTSSLIVMRDARWKDMRSTLSPAFTGSKMRQMFQLMAQVAQEAVAGLKQQMQPDKSLDLDVKDYATRYTNDIIASTAFGLQVNSFKERDNKFYQLGKKLTTFSTLQNLKFLLISINRSLMKRLNIRLFDKATTEYFMHLVLDAMKYRQQHHIVRPDMIHMLMESRGMLESAKAKSQNRDWSDVDIVAQCFIFFFAGFETSSTLICFAAHELMENEAVQSRLYEEVLDVHNKLEGKELTYEALMGMKYMDQVIQEVLRKWPPTMATDRECSKDISYEVDGRTVQIRQGETVWLPACGLHRDPKYFENPDKFDPERFSEENKDKIQPFAYFPFGLGQRNCIGSRFALLEAKAVVYYLLRDFRIAAAKNTTTPMVLSAAGFQLMPKNGFWLKFIARD